MSVIIKAAEIAKDCHAGQLRKYTGRPYIEHPLRVAGHTTLVPGVNEDVIAAAWLHDVVEDCDISAEDLAKNISFPVMALVSELTNPSKAFPKLRRAARKEMDREHLARVSRWAKIIKLIDRIDNVRDMNGAEADFKRLYARESIALLNVLLDPADEVIFRLCERLSLAIEQI